MNLNIDTSKLDDLKFIIETLYLEPVLTQDVNQHLQLMANTLKTLNSEEKLNLADYFYNYQFPLDNAVSFYLFLWDTTADYRFRIKLELEIQKINSLGVFYEVFWNIISRQFVSSDDQLPLYNLRTKFHELTQQANNYLKSRALLYKRNITKVKRIAILSPQILGMHHSPTREAFSLACHLTSYHDCEVYIINTNSLCYGTKLNIFKPFIANHHANNQQQQTINVNYLHFKNMPINVINFPAQIMGLRKLVDVVDVINQLEFDGILAHGENLFIQEALFKNIPSLFITTGNAVPYAHCDSYWVPGNLLSEQLEHFANQYGHFSFLRESMIVTPEGKAELPAKRLAFGVTQQAFIYLVVGTRLETEIEAEFAALCQKLLSNSENTVILFAGSNGLDLSLFFSDQLISTNRVINCGFREDLAEICLMSDVYLNPKRQGGGTSSQTAIMNGLPIVTLDYGHISAVVPTTVRHANWQSYYDYALSLYNDANFFAEQISLFSQHFTTHLKIEDQVAKIYHTLVSIAENHYQS